MVGGEGFLGGLFPHMQASDGNHTSTCFVAWHCGSNCVVQPPGRSPVLWMVFMVIDSVGWLIG